MPTVAIPTYIPITMYLNRTQPLISESSDLLGGCYIILRSGGLNPKAVAGKPSVTRLTHKSCTDENPSGIPSRAVKKMLATSPIFEEIKYLMNAFMLL